MIWVDYIILAIIGLSVIISLLRGFIREALSLATWVVAVWVGLLFADALALRLEAWITVPSARMAVAFVVLFIAVLILGALVNTLVGQLVRKTGLTGTDRMLGVFFGVARGVVIVAVLVLVAGFTVIPQDPWWSESPLLVHFERMALWMRDYLPADIAANIEY